MVRLKPDDFTAASHLVFQFLVPKHLALSHLARRVCEGANTDVHSEQQSEDGVRTECALETELVSSLLLGDLWVTTC